MAKFDNVKVGDKLWSSTDGWGAIYKISYTEGNEYPLMVEFGESMSSYTLDGRLYATDKYPTLFFKELEGYEEFIEKDKEKC